MRPGAGGRIPAGGAVILCKSLNAKWDRETIAFADAGCVCGGVFIPVLCYLDGEGCCHVPYPEKKTWTR